MNDLQGDKEISALDQAAINDLKERSRYQAEQDYAGFKELSKSVAYQKVFLRRLRMKREDREKSVCGGVALDRYPLLIAEIALLKDIEALVDVERVMAWKELNPGLASEPKD